VPRALKTTRAGPGLHKVNVIDHAVDGHGGTARELKRALEWGREEGRARKPLSRPPGGAIEIPTHPKWWTWWVSPAQDCGYMPSEPIYLQGNKRDEAGMQLQELAPGCSTQST
jgi:hypothetical protein